MIKKIYARQMSAQIESVSVSEQDTIEVVWTTGAKALRSDFNTSFYEELRVDEQACDLTRLNSGAPFLSQHEQNVSQTLGVVERAWIENGLGKAQIRFSKRSELQGMIEDIKSRILRNISVGYRVYQYTDISKKNDSIPTYLATKWEPVEISLVAVPADAGAQTLRSQSESENEVNIIMKEDSMTEEELKLLEELQAKRAAQPEQIQATQNQVEQPATILAPTVDIEAEKRQAVEEFQKRSIEIKTAVRASGFDYEFAEDLIGRGLSVEEASKEIFRKLETQNQIQNKNSAIMAEVKMTKREMAIEALMYRANSRKHKLSENNELTKDATLIDIASLVIERKTGETDAQFAKRAITSSDLADVLVSASNKIVSEANYAGATYPKWTRQLTLRDFKSTPIVSLSNYELASVTEGGDYSEASLTDSKEEIQLRQRGKILSLSLKAMINDDAGVLEQLPAFAEKAGYSDLESACFGVLNSNAAMADSVALFHATHKNLIADATGVDVASMARAEQLLAEATDAVGVQLDLKPKFIIVAPKYAMAARKIVGSMVASASDNFNPYANSGIEVIVSNRLTDKESWYVVADPAQMAAIASGTLQGMEQPTVSSEEQFSSSNTRMKVEFHNAAKSVHYQAIIKLTIV